MPDQKTIYQSKYSLSVHYNKEELSGPVVEFSVIVQAPRL